MVNRRISNNLKVVALRLRARGQDTLEDILDIVDFSRQTFFGAQKWFTQTGSVAKTQAIGRGRPRKALRADVQYLLRLSRHKPIFFLDEYQWLLQEKRLISLSLSTIHRELARAGNHLKHIQKSV